MKAVLISAYELGRQPFGLASPAAWLKQAGVSVSCLDLAVDPLREDLIESADLVAFYVPMHTATRLASNLVKRVLRLNPTAHLCFYGLYAPVNESFLRQLGAHTIIGGEFEQGLVDLVERLSSEPSAKALPQPSLVSMARQQFVVPDRSGLPELSRYAFLNVGPGQRRVVGYTEATRGCKHLCRHCPIVPVYEGRFRVVQREVVLADIEQQVRAGAEHITFGDPDFFNGPSHALTIVEALHEQFPHLTYDVTIKVEHLLRQARHLPTLRDTGCAFVVSAVESVDDRILEIFDKGHTRRDFLEVISICRQAELTLTPTFVTFTPWTSLGGYVDLLNVLLELDLIDSVAPIQYAIRLLIPAGSRLLELAEVQQIVGEFDQAALSYPWVHPDPAVDQLHRDVLRAVKESQSHQETRRETFQRVWRLAQAACESSLRTRMDLARLDQALPRAEVPYLSEPWYC